MSAVDRFNRDISEGIIRLEVSKDELAELKRETITWFKETHKDGALGEYQAHLFYQKPGEK